MGGNLKTLFFSELPQAIIAVMVDAFFSRQTAPKYQALLLAE